MQRIRKRPDFIHHQKSGIISFIREIVFGVEDGMISTLGVLVGIAIGTNSYFVIILSGFVIIIVESISMGVGSYLSVKSVKEIAERKLKEENISLSDIKNYDEFFITSTTKNVMPINQIDDIQIDSDFEKTKIVQKLFKNYYRKHILNQ